MNEEPHGLCQVSEVLDWIIQKGRYETKGNFDKECDSKRKH